MSSDRCRLRDYCHHPKLHSQISLDQTALDHKRDYLLGVKVNQRTLHHDLVDYFRDTAYTIREAAMGDRQHGIEAVQIQLQGA